ncbi:hypothetical protein [Mycolicibacterium sp. XJ870]
MSVVLATFIALGTEAPGEIAGERLDVVPGSPGPVTSNSASDQLSLTRANVSRKPET